MASDLSGDLSFCWGLVDGTCPHHPNLRPPSFHLPSPQKNSPSRLAQEVQEGETEPAARDDRGHLLGRNHLCSHMPYFKRVPRLQAPQMPWARCEAGERAAAPAGCAPARSHSPALRQPEPSRVGRVCVRAGPGRRGTCPRAAPPGSPSSSSSLQSGGCSVQLAPHPFMPAPGWSCQGDVRSLQGGFVPHTGHFSSVRRRVSRFPITT